MASVLSGGLHPYDAKVLALAPTFYFPLTELAGTTIREIVHGWNGAYPATGVTYGAAGPGDGRTAVTFDGSGVGGNLYTAGLSAGFMHGGKGTLCLWVKFDNWTQASTTVLKFQKDASNSVDITSNMTNDRIQNAYLAGGTTKATSEASGQTTTAFRHVAMTWDITAGADGEMKLYINGSQVGTTQTALGTWGVTDLNAVTCVLGNGALAAGVSIVGSVARLAGFPVALTQAQLATLAAF